MFVIGLGIGLVMQVIVVAVQNSVPHAQLGTATATATFFRTIGGAFGVAILGAVFTARLLANLTKGTSAAVAKRISTAVADANPAQIHHLPTSEKLLVVSSFSHALQDVFIVALPFALLAFVLSWLMKEIPLRQQAHTSLAPDSAEDTLAVDMPGL
jgi:hypothetical protein